MTAYILIVIFFLADGQPRVVPPVGFEKIEQCRAAKTLFETHIGVDGDIKGFSAWCLPTDGSIPKPQST